MTHIHTEQFITISRRYLRVCGLNCYVPASASSGLNLGSLLLESCLHSLVRSPQIGGRALGGTGIPAICCRVKSLKRYTHTHTFPPVRKTLHVPKRWMCKFHTANCDLSLPALCPKSHRLSVSMLGIEHGSPVFQSTHAHTRSSQLWPFLPMLNSAILALEMCLDPNTLDFGEAYL